MSIGAVLVGVGLALLVGAYLARPFRSPMDPDRAIERWVAEARRAERQEAGREGVNYCPKCGRHVHPDDRFCAGCGNPLPRG